MRDLVRSRGLGDVYKRQALARHGMSEDEYGFSTGEVYKSMWTDFGGGEASKNAVKEAGQAAAEAMRAAESQGMPPEAREALALQEQGSGIDAIVAHSAAQAAEPPRVLLPAARLSRLATHPRQSAEGQSKRAFRAAAATPTAARRPAGPMSMSGRSPRSAAASESAGRRPSSGSLTAAIAGSTASTDGVIARSGATSAMNAARSSGLSGNAPSIITNQLAPMLYHAAYATRAPSRVGEEANNHHAPPHNARPAIACGGGGQIAAHQRQVGRPARAIAADLAAERDPGLGRHVRGRGGDRCAAGDEAVGRGKGFGVEAHLAVVAAGQHHVFGALQRGAVERHVGGRALGTDPHAVGLGVLVVVV